MEKVGAGVTPASAPPSQSPSFASSALYLPKPMTSLPQRAAQQMSSYVHLYPPVARALCVVARYFGCPKYGKKALLKKEGAKARRNAPAKRTIAAVHRHDAIMSVKTAGRAWPRGRERIDVHLLRRRILDEKAAGEDELTWHTLGYNQLPTSYVVRMDEGDSQASGVAKSVQPS
ncbi:hypothetical protein B0H19DRAFT_1254290 [Mycena capillaripes]|nr:hypothetical protein B0H19DRAFT_1254290 [Mycena capillaripes]